MGVLNITVGLMIPMGPFQLRLFYDSTKFSTFPKPRSSHIPADQEQC